jgi:diguanylate cyclase (GGDEF)-like protein
MAAAAAARKWWAAHRRRSPEPTRLSTPDGTDTKAARITLFLPVFLAGAMILCAAIGFAATQLGASHIEAERHAALRQALDEFGAASDNVEKFDDAQLRRIERRAGVQDLRFDAEPTRDDGRELQSVHDTRGRIVGWFSWVADGALVHAMDRLWGLFGAVGAVLAVAALLAVRASQQLLRSLDHNSETLRKLTSQDALTGLPNHGLMLKSLNDALARAGGDAVLLNIAEHLQAGLPAGALCGRFEEDEFAVVVSSEDRRIPTVLADLLRASLQRPIFVDRMWQITAGIGVAQAPQDGTTGEEVARRAGLALRAAKREGRGRAQNFEPQIESEYAERRFLLRELQSAISLQTFDVHYQPVVAADGGAIVGVEALLRWTHPSRGAIAPAVFIPLAEQSGLMSQLGEIVLRRALADGVRWPNLSVAVNLSPLQIRDRWLVDLVGAIMAETGIASSRVVLEVTEGVLIDNPQEAQVRLEALRALGVSIALDDFGTGYSSLSYLQKFPIDRLKIDRAFVASLGSSGSTGAIIQSIVTLGHALGMKVLAEGVENDEQRVLLRLAGCDEMQGYLFARPGPAAEIDKALVRQARSAAG